MSLGATILRATARHRWIGPLVALLVTFTVFSAMMPDRFLTLATLTTMARGTSVVGIAATGMTLVVIIGGIDLSVGSTVALTTVVIALALKSDFGVAGALACGLGMAIAMGAVNGGLTVGLDITPFIVTLGTMEIIRGTSIGLAKEQRVYLLDAHGIDALVLPDHYVLGVPLAVWLLLVTAISVAILLNNTRFGRKIFAVGSNERTALLAGIRVKWVKVATYAIAGGLTGLAGLVEFARLGVGDPTDSTGLELAVIAATVIGGGSLSGGEGSVVGAIFGAMLMTVIQTGCQYLGLPNWIQRILTGAIIITASGLDRFRQKQLA
jgi:ribose transport system permease protein